MSNIVLGRLNNRIIDKAYAQPCLTNNDQNLISKNRKPNWINQNPPKSIIKSILSLVVAYNINRKSRFSLNR